MSYQSESTPRLKRRERIADLEALLPFVRDAAAIAINGLSDDLQNAAIDGGIIEMVPYDPAEHGESDLEPGEPWLVIAPEVAETLGA